MRTPFKAVLVNDYRLENWPIKAPMLSEKRNQLWERENLWTKNSYE